MLIFMYTLILIYWLGLIWLVLQYFNNRARIELEDKAVAQMQSEAMDKFLKRSL